jgi:hypothetical protein
MSDEKEDKQEPTSPGITATKTVGACVFSIQGGIIVNVTGC